MITPIFDIPWSSVWKLDLPVRPLRVAEPTMDWATHNFDLDDQTGIIISPECCENTYYGVATPGVDTTVDFLCTIHAIPHYTHRIIWYSDEYMTESYIAEITRKPNVHVIYDHTSMAKSNPIVNINAFHHNYMFPQWTFTETQYEQTIEEIIYHDLLQKYIQLFKITTTLRSMPNADLYLADIMQHIAPELRCNFRNDIIIEPWQIRSIINSISYNKENCPVNFHEYFSQLDVFKIWKHTMETLRLGFSMLAVPWNMTENIEENLDRIRILTGIQHSIEALKQGVPLNDIILM